MVASRCGPARLACEGWIGHGSVGVVAVVPRCDVLQNSMAKAKLMAGLRYVCMRVGSRVRWCVQACVDKFVCVVLCVCVGVIFYRMPHIS